MICKLTLGFWIIANIPLKLIQHLGSALTNNPKITVLRLGKHLQTNHTKLVNMLPKIAKRLRITAVENLKHLKVTGLESLDPLKH